MITVGGRWNFQVGQACKYQGTDATVIGLAPSKNPKKGLSKKKIRLALASVTGETIGLAKNVEV